MRTDASGPLRRLLRRLPVRLRWSWHRHRNQLIVARKEGLANYMLWMARRTAMWLVTRAVGPRTYVYLSPDEASRHRRSDTVFIFGSGYSLNDITPEEWEHIRAHDTFGSGIFVFQQFVRVDFHLVRSWDPSTAAVRRWPRPIRNFADHVRDNPRFRDAISFVQDEHSGITANTLVGLRLLEPGSRLVSYWTARRLDDAPTRRWRDGISHAQGATVDCVNIAYLLGWKQIVLVGVDLYDNRYYCGGADGTLQFHDDGTFGRSMPTQDHGARWDEPHLTARRGVVELLGRWTQIFAAEGVRLAVWNPRSLLAGPLPVYERPTVASL